MLTDEDALVTQAVRGDAEALGALLEQFALQTTSSLARKIDVQWRTMLEIDDVLQTTFLEAFLRIGQCKADNAASFFAWVRSIAEHNLTDAIRGLRCEKRPQPHRRIHAAGTTDSHTALHDLLIGYTATGSRVAARREAAGLLEAAITKLPAEYARVVRLLDLEGVSAAEIGERIGKSRGAVHMLRARALGRLQDLLGTKSRFFSHSA